MIRIRLAVLAVAGVSALWMLPPAKAAGVKEDFSTEPGARSWRAAGQTNLFRWNGTNQNLEVTWDSAQANSYFYCPLGATLTKTDSFSLTFDLRLSDFVAGIDPDMPNPFQLSLGLINLAEATQPGFVRGSGWQSPDLIDFSFFPDPGGAWLWGPSLTAMMADGTGSGWSTGGYLGLALTEHDLFHVKMTYTAHDQTLRTVLTSNGWMFAALSESRLGTNFQDFQVDHVAICSYSQVGQYPGFEGSILAHGTVDNLSVALLPSLSGAHSNGVWQAQALGQSNWLYTLERSIDFTSWSALPPSVSGDGSVLRLQDTNPPSTGAFYRLRVE